ncbi:MAG: VWA domain-containing protein [Candidatus Bathyarchaeota archaeon]|nr:MAG: VWA domain-containing protein [Candidatus Bathyarchaeota archaeon]
MRTRVFANAALVLSFIIVVLSLQTSYASMDEAVQFETGVRTQLCMVIDGSDSMMNPEWGTIKQGIAEAINSTMPRDGSVELTVVQFGYSSDDGHAKTEIPPTVINGTNYAAISNQVLAMKQGGIGTSMAHGLYLGWREISNSPNFDIARNQIINLATDGEPNRRNHNATSDLDGDKELDCWDDAIAVVNNAVSEGLEELDVEGIGISNSSCYWFKDWIVHPQPGTFAPPFCPPGWIRVVEDAAEFAMTIDQKLQSIVVPEKTCMFAVNVVGGGSVSRVPDQVVYSYGVSVELVVVADPGWTFSEWSGDLAGSATPGSIILDGNKTVTALFTEDQIWAPSLQSAVAGGVATVVMSSTLAAMSSSLTNPVASVRSTFWGRIVAALPDSLQNLLQSYGEEILASKTQKGVGTKEFSRLMVTQTEVLAFVLGAATLTFCFSYAVAGATTRILSVVPIVFVAVAVVELVYWLTMEVVARRMGIWSEYRVWPMGIIMLLVFTLAFRSPFCVAGRSEFQSAKPAKRVIGLISLSGPVACLLLGGLFAVLLSFGYEQLGSLGVMVCMTKATFDLIPTRPMNGKEIFNWNKIIWLMLFLPGAASYLFFILNF